MPLQPVAQAAVADRNLKSVRFAMKDGSRQISVFVSSPALESIEIAPLGDDGHFLTFKLYRKAFEQIASRKFDMGHVEPDGTLCIRARDVPLASMH